MTDMIAAATPQAAEGRTVGPLVMRRQNEPPLESWARERRAWIDDALLQHGALLFRGFGIETTDAFEPVSRAMCDRLADYMYRSTPRTNVGSQVYTATEYPADTTIPMHNENAYQRSWPMKLLFCCVQPAAHVRPL